MPLFEIGSTLAGAVGKVADWRNAAGERKLEKAKLRAQSQANSWTDEGVIFTVCALVLFVGVVLPLWNDGSIAKQVVANLHMLFDGPLGETFQYILIIGAGGGTVGAAGSRIIKRWKN